MQEYLTEFQKTLGILNWIDKRHYSHKTKLMKDSIFEIALELIKMAKTSVWYFFRNVSSISNSTQHFNEFLVSMARRRHRHKSLYTFFALLCFQQRFVLSIVNIDSILFIYNWPKKYIFIVFSISIFHCFAHEDIKKHPQKKHMYF